MLICNNIFFRIIQAINTVFYRHLCNWIIYGDLVDTCNEFFIGDANCADENFLYPEQLKESESTAIEIFHDSFVSTILAYTYR